MALLVFVVVGSGVALGFRRHEQAKEAADARPSIADFSPANLPESVSEDAIIDTAESAAPAREDAVPAKLDAPAGVVVKVLNGGAAGGSAGKMVMYLKTSGYAKAEAGNANGSNAGIVIYYSSGMEDEAKALQLTLLKLYKGVESKAASDAKVPEAKTAPIVVVLGS